MEDLYFDDIVERINTAYINLFLLAIKKKEDLRIIVDDVVTEIDNYFDNTKGFIPDGMDGLLFFSAVAQAMDSSLFDILYLSEKEKERIIQNIIDEIDIDNVHYYALDEENSFTYNYFVYGDDEYAAYYNLTFECDDDGCRIRTGIFSLPDKIGFDTDLMYDSAVIWEGNKGEICRFIVEMIEDLEDKHRNNDKTKETKIEYKDFFVHSYSKKCDHEYIKVTATVPIYSHGEETTITFDADYCAECGIYYISEYEYQNHILPVGRLLCPVMSSYEYSKYNNNLMNNEEQRTQSILNMFGYNVNSKDNLRDQHRITILRYIIESGIVSQKTVIFYLQLFIKRSYPKTGMEKAISKWKKDLQWAMNYKKNGNIIYGVRRIILGNYNQNGGFMTIPEGIEGDLPFK